MPDSDTGSLHRVIQFDVYNLGVVRDVNMGGFRGRKSDPNIQLVNKAEEAQVSQNASMIVKELKLYSVSHFYLDLAAYVRWIYRLMFNQIGSSLRQNWVPCLGSKLKFGRDFGLLTLWWKATQNCDFMSRSMSNQP